MRMRIQPHHKIDSKTLGPQILTTRLKKGDVTDFDLAPYENVKINQNLWLIVKRRHNTIFYQGLAHQEPQYGSHWTLADFEGGITNEALVGAFRKWTRLYQPLSMTCVECRGSFYDQFDYLCKKCR